MTPPGSACSIGFGTGVTAAKPGSRQGLSVVADIFAARDEPAARGDPDGNRWLLQERRGRPATPDR